MRTTPQLLAVLVLMLGCQPEPTGSKQTTPTSPSPTVPYDPCDGRVVVAEAPADGELDVSIEAEIRWAFDVAEQEATLTVTDDEGDVVSGQQGWDGNTLVLRPTYALAPDTAYTAEVSFSCGTVSSSFTTEFIEAATAWEAQLDGGTIVQPAAVGPLISPFLTDSPLLVELLAEGADFVDLRLAQGTLGLQERCAETVEAPGVDFATPPLVRVEIASLQLSAQGAPMNVEQAVFTADLSPMYGTLSNVGLTGYVNVSGLDQLVGADTCELMVAFGAVCEPCPSGPTSCLYAEITSIPTTDWSGNLQERTAYDIEADASCP